MRIGTLSNDRRKDHRFPIQHDLRFKLLQRGKTVIDGTGRSVDISRGGVAFQTDRPVKIGALIELSVNWPVLLDGGCRIQLTVLGRVVRAEKGVAACTLTKYDFRTMARISRRSTAVAADAVLRQWAQAAS